MTDNAEPLTRMGRLARAYDRDNGFPVLPSVYYDEAEGELWAEAHSVYDVACRALELHDEAAEASTP